MHGHLSCGALIKRQNNVWLPCHPHCPKQTIRLQGDMARYQNSCLIITFLFKKFKYFFTLEQMERRV
jgi:hypothetical protein